MKREKVILFNPPSEFYAMPLGLLAVASALDPERYDVRIIDARIVENAAQDVLKESEDAICVGMTVFSGPSIGEAVRLCRTIKQTYRSLPIVWGGWHPSILPEQCIESGVVDAVVIAQGEATFRSLLAIIASRGDWFGIPGLCIAVNGKAHRTPPRAMVKMDDLPTSRYELLDVEAYFHRKGRRQIDYSSSRGCPYRCTFCADPIVYRNKWTGMSPERIVQELMDLHTRFRIEEVFFLDDDLFANLKRIQALAERFVSAKVPFVWKGTARADELCRLPKDCFRLLRASGCVKINIGAESGSQRILDRVKKDYKVDEILEAAHRASEVNIAVTQSFITGFPGEDESDFQATVDTIKAVRRVGTRTETVIYLYSPYPGTELTRQLEENGMCLPKTLEAWEHFDIEGAWLPKQNPRFVNRVQNLNFYLRHAYSTPSKSIARRLLRCISRLRCEHDWYDFPVERYVAEAFQACVSL